MYGEYKYVTPEYEARLNKLATDLMIDRYLKTQQVAEDVGALVIPFPIGENDGNTPAENL